MLRAQAINIPGGNTGASRCGGKHTQMKRCTEAIDWNGMDLIPVQRESLVAPPTVLGRSDDENKRSRINHRIEILHEGDLTDRDWPLSGRARFHLVS